MNAPDSQARAAFRQPQFFQAPRAVESVREEVQAGLLAQPAQIPPKFFYDTLGSRLFDAITALDEYYPTRSEAQILAAHGADFARVTGPAPTLVDLGAGSCEKAVSLFPALQPRRYVAVDISADYLRDILQTVQRAHPALEVIGVGTDFATRLDLPEAVGPGPRAMFYPGSSIGNFTPEQALGFLQRVREAAQGGSLLIGVDRVKDAGELVRAYDDALGVTAAFNLNVLRHLNRRIGSDFVLADWRHVARFDIGLSRIEMHLEARHALTVRWPGGERSFAAGERIHTENSCKYTPEAFEALLRAAGWQAIEHWSDPQSRFSVFAARA